MIADMLFDITLLQRRSGNGVESPQQPVAVIDDVIADDRKRKYPVTSRSVTWGEDVVMANHCIQAPVISRSDDDDDVCTA